MILDVKQEILDMRKNKLGTSSKKYHIQLPFILKIFTVLFVITVLHSCKKFIPSNIYPYSMVKIGEGTFIDQTEITVEQYAEFVYDGNENHKPDSKITSQFKHHQVFYPSETPDSLFRAFGKIDYYNLPIPFEYFDTLNYSELRVILDRPVTGVDQENIESYIHWRTVKHNEIKQSKQSISFRLVDDNTILIGDPHRIHLDVEEYTTETISVYDPKKGFRCIANTSK